MRAVFSSIVNLKRDLCRYRSSASAICQRPLDAATQVALCSFPIASPDALVLPDRSSSLADPPNVLDRQQAPILQGFSGRREVKRNGAIVQENSTLLLCYSHLAAGRRFLDMVSKMTEPPCKGRSCRKNLKTWDDSPQSLPRSPICHI